MASRPQGTDYSSAEQLPPRDRVYYSNINTTQTSHGQNIAPDPGASRASTAMGDYYENSSRRSEMQRASRSTPFPNSSGTAFLSSTQASTGSSPPPSSQASARAYDPTISLSNRFSRSTQPAVRPSAHTAATLARPSMGLDAQYRPAQMLPRGTVQDSEHYTAAVAGGPQQSLFANPHGIREASVPPVRPAGRARPVSMVATPTFTNNFAPMMSKYVESSSRAPPMPGAFPGDIAVPNRRPTDLNTHLSSAHESSEQVSSNSDIWDSEGDSGSNLSTSTDATTVASDITVGGKDEIYTVMPAHGASSSSGVITPTQDQYEEASGHSRQAHRAPLAPILRRATHNSALSSSSKTNSSSSAKTAPSAGSHKPLKTASSGSGAGSLSSRLSGSQSSAPQVHIEVHKPSTRRESHSEARIQQKIEKVLHDHLNLIEQRKSECKEPASTHGSSATPKQGPTVRFAAPEPRDMRSAPGTTLKPAPEKETNSITKELVLQGKEIHKLELELEKRDQIIKEKDQAALEKKRQDERDQAERKKQEERAELEKRAQDERAHAEREKQRERELQNAEIEKRDKQKAQKTEQQARELERQQHEREKKDAEKALKAQERERARERQRVEKEKKEIEEEKAKIKKAQEEHDLLHLSFMDQGRILSDLKARFDGQAKKLEATEAERNELQRAKDEFEGKCSDLSKCLSHVSDKERYVVEQVASLQIIKDSLQKRVGPLEERAMKLASENSELVAERDGMIKDMKKYLEQITGLEKESKALIEEKRSFIAQIGDLEKVKAELRAEVKSLKEHAALLEANLEARATDYSEHIAVLRNEHKLQVEALEAHIAGINAQHQVQTADLEDQIVSLNEHIDVAHDDMKALRLKLAKEKSRHDALLAKFETLSIDLEGQRIYAVEQEVTIMNLREDLSRRSDVIARLQDTNKTLQAEHDELQKLADEIPDVRQTGTDTSSSEYKALRTSNDELVAAKSGLEAKNAELEALVTSTKTELEAQLDAAKKTFEARVAETEAAHAATRTALAAELASTSTLEDTASKVSTLEEEAAKVPALLSEKAALEEEAAKVPVLQSDNATLEAKTAELQAKVCDLEAQASQLPTLRSECAKLAEQLAAANKLIDGLTAVQQAANAGTCTTTGTPASPAVTPLSPTFPPPPAASVVGSAAGSAGSPRLAPQDGGRPPQQKARSRAQSMSRSVPSRTSSKRSVRDDIALVMVRSPADRSAVQVIRKCDLRDLRTPRSRSQPPEKE